MNRVILFGFAASALVFAQTPVPEIPFDSAINLLKLPTNIYRLDSKTGRATVVVGDFVPNGLAFSPDEKKIYFVDYGSSPLQIRVYDVVDDGTKVANGRVFVRCEPGETPDGYRCDIEGNLWCGWGTGEGRDGVVVFQRPGALPEASLESLISQVRALDMDEVRAKTQAV